MRACNMDFDLWKSLCDLVNHVQLEMLFCEVDQKTLPGKPFQSLLQKVVKCSWMKSTEGRNKCAGGWPLNIAGTIPERSRL